MNMKKIMAGVVASALAVSTMAVSAFAVGSLVVKDTDVDASSGQWLFKSEESTIDFSPADVRGVAIQVTVDEALLADEEAWLGGGIGVNSNSTAWANLAEFGKSEKAILLDATKATQVLTYTSDAAIFADDDEYAGFWLQNWADGTTITINGMAAFDADGNALAITGTVEGYSVAAAADDTAADDTAADDTAAPDDTAAAGDTSAPTASDKGAADTGVEGVAVVAGLAIVAAGAVIVAKKRG